MNNNHTILFVDDEPMLADALIAKLESKGFNCIALNNMTDGLNYIKNHNVSLLVTDIMMPAGKDFPNIDSSETGFHFVEKIRKEFPEISIICLSVIGNQKKINELKNKGILYLRKGETPLSTAANLIESKVTGVISFGEE